MSNELFSFLRRLTVVEALESAKSLTQSPQALWSGVGRQERLWGTGILLPQDFCGKAMEVEFSRVSPGDQLLAKEPENSGYEIGKLIKCIKCLQYWYILIGQQNLPIASDDWPSALFCTQLAF